MKSALIKIDGRVGPLWEHWAIMSMQGAMPIFWLYLLMGWFTDLGYEPLLIPVGAMTGAALSIWTWRKDVRINAGNEHEVSQSVPRRAYVHLVMAVALHAMAFFHMYLVLNHC